MAGSQVDISLDLNKWQKSFYLNILADFPYVTFTGNTFVLLHTESDLLGFIHQEAFTSYDAKNWTSKFNNFFVPQVMTVVGNNDQILITGQQGLMVTSLGGSTFDVITGEQYSKESI